MAFGAREEEAHKRKEKKKWLIAYVREQFSFFSFFNFPLVYPHLMLYKEHN